MATRYPNDCEIYTNIDSPCTVEWQVFAMNSESSLEKLCSGTDPTLPPLTEIIEFTRDNRDIFITFNRTLKGLNKPIIIHWGDQTASNADYVQMHCPIPQLASIEVEYKTEDYIVLHPTSQQHLMEIYTELTNNPEYIRIMSESNMLMVDKISNGNPAQELEVNRGGHQNLNPDLLQVLKILAIEADTIGNLTFIESITIDNSLNQKEPAELKQLPLYMLRNIMLHRHNYRELITESISQQSSEFFYSTEDLCENFYEQVEDQFLHSMDIFLLLFFQCNILYRQVFVENVAQCQSSLPLITMDPYSNNIIMYDFSLRKLKKTCVINKTVEEFRVFMKPMPIISFIRLESAGLIHSKSKMLNRILEVDHEFFFHREVSESSTESLLLPGTIEIGWYLPKKRGDNAMNQCITFLNLRGNSHIYDKQVSFLENVSELIFIYISLIKMKEQEWQFLNKLFSKHGSKIVLLIEEMPNKPKYNLKDLTNFKSSKLNWIPYTYNIPSVKTKIIDSINFHTQHTDAKRSIDDCVVIAGELGIILESKSCVETECFPKVIDGIIFTHIDKSSKKITLSKLKNDMFKLQGKWWEDWSNYNRSINRVQMSSEGIETNIARIHDNMKKSRNEQIHHLCNLETSTLKLLAVYLTDDKDNMMSSLIFFRILKIFLEDLALEILPDLYLQLRTHAAKLHKEDTEKWMIESIQDITMGIEHEISESSVGEEHIMREFAQIYESTTTVDQASLDIFQNKNLLEEFSVRKLPKMAAQFLLSGIPLEILDGDVCQVPTTWIKSVFQEIGKIVGVSKKVYIVSILGIQSSGKSTLLNTMFGLQFPVSAGRCTKGAFIQLVPIHQSTIEVLGYDYLMVIDTEGLRGMEKKNSYDNELATFAVGLANLTIININGENQSDMQDILQIAIYALIRMKEVELNPKCIFIHQNVICDTADERLITQRNRLATLLNEMTLAAANQEDLSFIYNRFSDVIGFDPHNDVFYFSSLLKGEPPMAPVNEGYCQDASYVRSCILTKFQKSSQFYKLHDIGKRINDVWSCIMREDFVFHFRNVLELNVTLELETELAKWESIYTQQLAKWESQQLIMLSNLSGDKLELYWRDLFLLLSDKCKNLYTNEEQEIMVHFFENHKSKDILRKRQNDIEVHFVSTRAAQISNIHKNFERIYQNYHHSRFLEEMLNEVENKLVQEIMELYRAHKHQAEKGQFSDEKIEDLFLGKWDELAKGFPTETNKPTDIKLQLQQFFHNTEVLRCINSTDKNIQIGDMETFEQFGSSSEFHLEKKLHYIKIGKFARHLNITNRHSKRKDIHRFLRELQEDCQALIKSRFPIESNFSNNAFKWIFDLVDDKVRARNKENIHLNTRKRSYSLNKKLVHDFSFYQCCKLIPQFEKIQQTFLERNSIRNLVDSKKEQFEAYFISLWKGVQNEQCAANELATLVFNSITDSVHQVMERNIITIFKEQKYQFQTKYKSQLNIFIELCERDSFESYLLYIQNPIDYIRTLLSSQMSSFYAKDEIRQIILDSCSQKVTNLITTTVNAAREALRLVDIEFRTNEEESSGIPKHSWKNKFLELIQNDVPNISNIKLAIFDAYEIKDYTTFIQTFSELLCEKQTTFKAEMPVEYKAFSDIILKDSIKCRECCPSCNELCQRNIGRHVHYCGEFHRPPGLMGVKNSADKLVSRPCPSLVKSKGIIEYIKTMFTDSDSSDVTGGWRIDEKSAIDTRFWIWVMNSHRSEFETYYKATFDTNKPPTQTKDDILRELRDKSDSAGDTNSSHQDNSRTWYSQIVRILLSLITKKSTDRILQN